MRLHRETSMPPAPFTAHIYRQGATETLCDGVGVAWNDYGRRISLRAPRREMVAIDDQTRRLCQECEERAAAILRPRHAGAVR